MIHLGQKFANVIDLKSAIEEYEKQKCIQVSISHSRTIEDAKRRGLRKVINEELRYAEITYSCFHSGKYHSKSTGRRPNQSTYRQGCEFKIALKASEDGQFLEVVAYNEKHNHELNKKTFQCLPRQRALDDAYRKIASKVLRDTKKVVQKEMKKGNSSVTLENLHNLVYTGSRDNPLENILQRLKEKEGCFVEVLKSEENNLLGIFYQDEEMRKTYKAYPEIFFLDSIYKKNDRRMPLYVMLIENGNGESEIVALCLVTTETATVLTKIVSLFKRYNPSWEETEVILTYKDIIERDSFHSEFPNAKLLICLFHALSTIRGEITVEKNAITQGERDLCLELFQKMAYSENEEKYFDYYNQLKNSAPKSVVDYFNENWHNIRNMWVSVLQQKQGKTCGNGTNNHLESTHQKIKQVVKQHSKLYELFEDLLKLISSLRTERDCNAAAIQLKTPSNVQITNSAEIEYLRLLTPYAFAKVKEKFCLLDKINVVEVNAGGITVKSGEGILNVKPNECDCCYFNSMGLPCHHILKCRMVKNMNLYSPDIIDQRWTKYYYLENSRLTDPDENTEMKTVNKNAHISIKSSKSSPVLSHHQKLKIALRITTKLASLAAESKHYPQRIELLRNLVKLWEEGKEAIIIKQESSEEMRNEHNTSTFTLKNEDQNEPSTEIMSTNEQAKASTNWFKTTNIKTESAVLSPNSNNITLDREALQLTPENIPELPVKILKRDRPEDNDESH